MHSLAPHPPAFASQSKTFSMCLPLAALLPDNVAKWLCPAHIWSPRSLTDGPGFRATARTASDPTRKLAGFQPARPRNGTLATAKQQGPEGRTGPAGNGSDCPTSLSDPTRKLAGFQPDRPRNGAPGTAKQQGREGRTGAAGNGSDCPPSLSDPTRKLASFQPAPPRNGAFATAKQQGAEGRTGPAGNVTFWSD